MDIATLCCSALSLLLSIGCFLATANVFVQQRAINASAATLTKRVKKLTKIAGGLAALAPSQPGLGSVIGDALAGFARNKTPAPAATPPASSTVIPNGYAPNPSAPRYSQ